jgi:hypothetical protein
MTTWNVILEDAAGVLYTVTVDGKSEAHAENLGKIKGQKLYSKKLQVIESLPVEFNE